MLRQENGTCRRMRGAIWVLAALMVLLAPPVRAEEIPTPPQVMAHAAQRGAMMVLARTFRVDFDRDGGTDAVAFIHYGYGGLQPSRQEISLFRDTGGRLRHLREVKGITGSHPLDVRMRHGQLLIEMAIPRPGDRPCCPRGFRIFKVPLEAPPELPDS